MMTNGTTYTTGSTDRGDPYFEWLCKRAGAENYKQMAAYMHGMIFRMNAVVGTDANRLNDGLQQRVRFMERYGEIGSSTNRGPCTVLEFLVGLAGRMSFLMSGEEEQSRTKHYFHCLIRNLRLIKYNDSCFGELNGEFFTEEAIQRISDRTYGPDGDGGLFPLFAPMADQRTVEIWYQMQAWLNEHLDISVG